MLAAAVSANALTVTLSNNESGSPVVGRMLTWTATSTDTGTIRYRFRVRRPGGDYQMIRDFGPLPSLDWLADRDGAFEIEASAKNARTGEIAKTTAAFNVPSRVLGSDAVVNTTNHPLVFLFSAPACPANGRMRVRFQAAGGGGSMNFFLAGMYADSVYTGGSNSVSCRICRRPLPATDLSEPRR